MSPQSTMRAQFWYGLMLARGLKPRKLVCRADACRIARGPNRAPLRTEPSVYFAPARRGWRDRWRPGFSLPAAAELAAEEEPPPPKKKKKPLTRAVAHGRVKRRTEDGNVEFFCGIREALDVVEVRKRSYSAE